MKHIVLFAILISTFNFAQNKKVTEYNIQWWGYKLAKTASSSHTGILNLKSGDFKLKGKKLVGGTFILDMNSLTATDIEGARLESLNKHLKNGDFFETEKFPTASYTITSVTKSGSANFPYKINGNLTVKGITKKVSFPAKLNFGKIFTLESDKFSFDRQEFDIKYQSSMKDVVIKDEIDLKITASAK